MKSVLAFCVFLSLTFFWMGWWQRGGMGCPLGTDFRICYHAAEGDYTWAERQGWGFASNGWAYARWTAIWFLPFTLFPEEPAFLAFACISICSCGYLAWRMNEIKGGYLMFLVIAYPLAWMVVCGNVAPILAALCVTPLGSYAAATIKPYLAVVFVLHAVKDARRQTLPAGHAHLFCSGLDHIGKKRERER